MADLNRASLAAQLAARLRAAIHEGTYAAGAELPSEHQLTAQYRVSRSTVRAALAALRAEGLIEARQGSRTRVRDATGHTRLNRTVTRTAEGAYTTAPPGTPLENPAVTRTHADPATAAALDVEEGHPLFSVDRLYTTESGHRIAHRLLIPFATASGTELADHPDTDPEHLYAILAQRGPLTFTETAQARMPAPDEAAALQLPPGIPVLHLTRITHHRTRALIREDTTAPGTQAEATYRLTPARRPADRH
ncbi:GntR family transcriptional regulator [Streptomyces sp. YIM 98790]|uniref:GntR family transcriptional regulator n=1 Tax=Streptomyces sp. YIM 98790 TaxID=2689077 RepID=UPI001A9FB945|nr:GntR family transcriptional regulator [Streptomyces sp. YIM 98790]